MIAADLRPRDCDTHPVIEFGHQPHQEGLLVGVEDAHGFVRVLTTRPGAEEPTAWLLDPEEWVALDAEALTRIVRSDREEEARRVHAQHDLLDLGWQRAPHSGADRARLEEDRQDARWVQGGGNQ